MAIRDIDSSICTAEDSITISNDNHHHSNKALESND